MPQKGESSRNRKGIEKERAGKRNERGKWKREGKGKGKDRERERKGRESKVKEKCKGKGSEKKDMGTALKVFLH